MVSKARSMCVAIFVLCARSALTGFFRGLVGHRQLGSAPGRVRQRPQAKGQQRLGFRWGRDCLCRQTRTPNSCIRDRQCYQGPQRRRPTRRDRPDTESSQKTRRPFRQVRRQCCRASKQQARNAWDTYRRCGERRPSHERMGQDCELGSQGASSRPCCTPANGRVAHLPLGYLDMYLAQLSLYTIIVSEL